MTEHTADFNLARDFAVEVKAAFGLEEAAKIIRECGFSGLRDMMENGGERDFTTLVISCAWALQFRKPPFVPPPVQYRLVDLRQDSAEFAAIRKAAELQAGFLTKARELGCAVIGDEIVCNREQYDALNLHWTEIFR